jgi:GMP synthase PP-ATPase subunit
LAENTTALEKVKPDSVSEIQPGGVDSTGAAILFGWLIAVSLLKVFVPNISDGKFTFFFFPWKQSGSFM